MYLLFFANIYDTIRYDTIRYVLVQRCTQLYCNILESSFFDITSPLDLSVCVFYILLNYFFFTDPFFRFYPSALFIPSCWISMCVIESLIKATGKNALCSFYTPNYLHLEKKISFLNSD